METNDSILKEIKKYSAHIDRFRARFSLLRKNESHLLEL